MAEEIWLARQFEAHRGHLRGVAYRMLGSLPEAEDAVQEAWLRLNRTDAAEVGNLGGWLTTVVARICLDGLRARRSRREEALEPHAPRLAAGADAGLDPEGEAALADSVGLALLVVLQALAPAERVAFVLHDMFDLPFDEIGPIVGRTPTAARQLASRARRRVRGAPAEPDADIAARRRVVEAFLTASRTGDMAGLLAVLDPDVVVRSDLAAQRGGARPEMAGAEEVALWFKGRATGARAALLDGQVGAVVAPLGRLLVALEVSVRDGRIVELRAVADAERLAGIDIAAFD